jgi:hypothetical protein
MNDYHVKSKTFLTAALAVFAVLTLPSSYGIISAQALVVNIESYHTSDTTLLVNSPMNSGWKGVPNEDLEGLKKETKIGPFQVYYDYDERKLVSGSLEKCYLYMYVLRPGTSAAATRNAWYQKQSVVVSGNYLDGSIPVKVGIIDGGQEYDGEIDLILHRVDTSELVKSDHDPVEILDVGTSGVSFREIRMTNNSGCTIDFDDPQIEYGTGGPDLWKGKKIQFELPKPAQLFAKPDVPQTVCTLKFEPVGPSAFWASLMPYAISRPHASIRIKQGFRVQGGYEGSFVQEIRIGFKPAGSFLFLSVVAGGTIAVILSLMYTALFGRKVHVFGQAKTWRPRLLEVVKRWVIAVGVALIVFVLYIWVRGERQVILFDFPLDPYQCVPAMLIGFFVGTRPVYWYRIIVEQFEKSQDDTIPPEDATTEEHATTGGAPKPDAVKHEGTTSKDGPVAKEDASTEGAPKPDAVEHEGTTSKDGPVAKEDATGEDATKPDAAKHEGTTSKDGPVALVIAGILLLSLGGMVQGGEAFRPVSLAYAPQSNSLYVLSSPDNSLYRLKLDGPQSLVRTMRYHLRGTAKDHCLVRQGNLYLLATVSDYQPSGGVLDSLATVTVLPLDNNDNPGKVLEQKALGQAIHPGIFFDDFGKRLVLIDPLRQGIYELPVSLKGLAKSETSVFRNPYLRNPTSITAWGGNLFVGDGDQHAVYEVNVAGNTFRKIAHDVDDPDGLFISSDGARLYVADAGKGQVTIWNISTAAPMSTLSDPAFREPCAVTIDNASHIWIADRWAKKLFEFSQELHLVKTYTP